METHINQINHHIAMIDVALKTLDEHQLAKLEKAFIKIIVSAQMTLTEIKKMQGSPP